MNEKTYVEYHVNDLRNVYPDLKIVLISNYFNPTPMFTGYPIAADMKNPYITSIV